MVVAGEKRGMRQLCNGVVGGCDIFEVHCSIELKTLVGGYLRIEWIIATHGDDQSAEKCLN